MLGAVMSKDGVAYEIGAANGATILNVPALKLYKVSESGVQYVVRVIDIPEEYQDTVILANPYYTYEVDGMQVTIYDDAVYNSYAAVKG